MGSIIQLDQWIDNRPKNPAHFLQMCKQVLVRSDYEDLLCGISDPAYYNDLEEDLKSLVDSYYEVRKVN